MTPVEELKDLKVRISKVLPVVPAAAGEFRQTQNVFESVRVFDTIYYPIKVFDALCIVI